MDNQQTGAFIRELRKDKGLTQKELAAQLHLTDRAVSKWERGLCAPDLSTLEPLAAALGVTVSELIAGRRMEETPHREEIESSVQDTLNFSLETLRRKTQTFRRAYWIELALFLALLAAIAAVLWWKGAFSIVYRAESPDGTCRLTVYDRDIAMDRFTREDRLTVITDYPPGEGWCTVIYHGVFQGAWWAPDSDKFVLAFRDSETDRLVLHGRSTNTTSNLNAYLSAGIIQSELGHYDFQRDEGSSPEIHYQFLQWSLDGQAMLLYYSFTDTQQAFHEGYFWYDHGTGKVSGTLELTA